MGLRTFIYFIKSIFFILAIAHSGNIHAKYCVSAFGEPKYLENFSQFDYTAPSHINRDGAATWGALASFNSLNPFVIRGTPLPITSLLCFARLLCSPYEEYTNSYLYLAEDVEVDENYKWVKFRIRQDATFDDGSPITAEDVAFSFEMICTHNPMQKQYYRYVKKVEVIDKYTVIFICPDNKSNEIAHILGQISILPKAFFKNRDFGSTLSLPIPSSGPYSISSFSMKDHITFARKENWWGASVPSQKGKYNIKTLKVKVFSDPTVLTQALQAGHVDFVFENRIKAWGSSYNGPSFDSGEVKKTEFQHKDCGLTSGFFFNTRREIFKDRRVREAICIMVNGPWLNTNLFEGRYKRNNSYFTNSVLAHQGLPEGLEKEILEKYRKQLPKSIWVTKPAEEDTYNQREAKKKAIELFEEAGWSIENGVLTKNNKPFTFEIISDKRSFERFALHLKSTLKSIGIAVNVRLLDASVYQEKVDQLDFDMTPHFINQSLWPGNEQMSYWGSTSAMEQGTKNYAGIQNPVVDDLCEKLTTAQSYTELCIYTQALDRVLMSEHYMIPWWYFNRVLIGHKSCITFPQSKPDHQLARWAIETMWVEKKPVEHAKEQKENFLTQLYQFFQSLIFSKENNS